MTSPSTVGVEVRSEAIVADVVAWILSPHRTPPVVVVTSGADGAKPWIDVESLVAVRPDASVYLLLHLGMDKESPAYKRLILSHHKNLNVGDFLVDDRPCKNGAGKFLGEVIHFESDQFPDWPTVVAHLRERS